MAPKRRNYKAEDMAMALQMVRTGAMSRKAAAKAYGIPKTTLLDKLAGRAADVTPLGRKTVLTQAEERTLVEYTDLMCQIGYPLSQRELLLEVQRVLNIDGRKTPFSNNMPGKDWFRGFRKRHPEMAFRTPMSLGHERACINMDMINTWFAGVLKFLEREVPNYKQMLKDPRRILNADESGFPLSVKTGRVLAPTGSRHVYQVNTSTKTQITVMAGFNAFGEYVPPMILFPGERIRDIGLSGFTEATYAATPNGWMDSGAFVSFLRTVNEFLKKKEIAKPVLLFVDGHSTHMTLAAAEYCRKYEIILYCLLPNATHILQAADIGLFSPMKSSWYAAVKKWQMTNVGQAMTKKEFPAVFKATWNSVANLQNAANGFRRSGLFPFGPEGINQSKLAPSRMLIEDKENVPCPTPPVADIPTTEAVTPDTANPPSLVSGPDVDVSENNEITPVASLHNIPFDPSHVAPAFHHLNVPEPRTKRKALTIRQKLPKAVSGEEALKMLREREEKKQMEAKAKEERKKERELKRQMKIEEKERKKKAREE